MVIFSTSPLLLGYETHNLESRDGEKIHVEVVAVLLVDLGANMNISWVIKSDNSHAR
jgi:hypothetical protein